MMIQNLSADTGNVQKRHLPLQERTDSSFVGGIENRTASAAAAGYFIP